VGDDDDTAEDEEQRSHNCGGRAPRKSIEHRTSDSSGRSARRRTANRVSGRIWHSPRPVFRNDTRKQAVFRGVLSYLLGMPPNARSWLPWDGNAPSF
jgi:hypothetical protein